MTPEQFTAGLRRAGFEQFVEVDFHLPHGTMHKERYGPSGVRYLVGRK